MPEEIEFIYGALFFLVGWTFCSWGWWMMAWILLARNRNAIREKKTEDSFVPVTKSLWTIFKATPLLDEKETPEEWKTSLSSFFRESEEDGNCEIILGIHEKDRIPWKSCCEELKKVYPKARLSLVYRTETEIDRFENPKIAWFSILARHAKGDVWVWSDLDICVSKGFLKHVRQEYEEGRKKGENFLTCAYRVSESKTVWGGWDALFVNGEFLPGVLLLGSKGSISTAFGAVTVFDKKEIKRNKDWNKIGNSLADDYALAQKLGKGKLSQIIVKTLPVEGNLLSALSHYWRWQKTIRWCQPIGYAAQLSIIPLVGWVMGFLVLQSSFVLMGLVVAWGVEVFFGWRLLLTAGFSGIKSEKRILPALFSWPMLRMMCWILSWTPLPVVWRGKFWWTPQRNLNKV